MTEKNVFAYKLFFSLNISDFNYFYVKIAPPLLERVIPFFPSNSPLKVEILSSPPFLKILLETQPPLPPRQKGRGLPTMDVQKVSS